MLTNTLVKTADRVDAVGDTEYESAFSNIAHAVIRRKAPALVPYELGFQLLDRAEDDSKAVGALLYTVGQKLLVIPLVFVNGELKGADAIYLQDDNLYLPLSEEWIKAVLAHYQQPLGSGVPRSRASQGYTTPDLHQAYGLRPKYARFLADWYRNARDKDLTQKTAALKEIGLVDFLTKAATSDQITAFTKALHSDPLLGQWYERRFGFDTLKHAATQAVLRESGKNLLATKKVAAEPSVKLLRYDGVMPTGLDADSQHQLTTQGWTILDKRAEEEKSSLITETKGLLKNPTQSGVYDVMKADGKFCKALVVLRPITRAMQGQGLIRDGELAAVVEMDGSRAHTNSPLLQVWVKNHEPDRETEGLKGLPKLDSLSPGEDTKDGVDDPSNQGSYGISTVDPLRPLEDDETGKPTKRDCCDEGKDIRNPGYLFLSPDCKDGTGLFTGFRLSAGSGGNVFTGYVADYLDSRDMSPGDIQNRQAIAKQSILLEGIVISDVEDSRPIHDGRGFLRLPGNWRALKVGPHTLRLGNPQTLAKSYTKSATSVVVSGDRLGFVVDNQHFDRGGATWRLVDGFGLSIKDAAALLTSAERSLKTAYVKSAAPAFPDLMQQMSSAQSPYNGGFSGPQMEAGQMAVEDQYREPPPANPDYTFIRDTMQDSGQTGLPELTELGGLTSLLQTSSEDRIIDEKLPKLTQAVDAVAQLLLHLYIHTDVFVTRYGKSDTKELEAGLKNTLESLGKTLYHLKHRTVSSQPEATLVDQDLRDSTD